MIFGNLPIATKVAHLVHSRGHTILAAVIEESRSDYWDPFDEEGLQSFCQESGVKYGTLAMFEELVGADKPDIGVSARFSKRIPRKVISNFSIGILNFHGGLLPAYAGPYSPIHMLLNSEKRGGSTIHWIDDNFDTGPIVSRDEFIIAENDTVLDVFQSTQLSLWKQFVSLLPRLEKTTELPHLDFSPEEWRYYSKQDISGLKDLTTLFSQGKEQEILRRIRAFDHPGHEPAFLQIDGQKILLRMKREH